MRQTPHKANHERSRNAKVHPALSCDDSILRRSLQSGTSCLQHRPDAAVHGGTTTMEIDQTHATGRLSGMEAFAKTAAVRLSKNEDGNYVMSGKKSHRRA